MKLTATILCLLMPTLSIYAATFSGVVENKYGDFIGFTNLTASKSGSGEVIHFTTGRGGEFSVELSDGTWSITADIAQISGWGYGALENYEVAVADSNISQNVVLLASEPLIAPSMTIYYSNFNDFRLSIAGQGGTRIKIERSTNLTTWFPYYERTLAKLGLTTSANPASGANRAFYRISSSTE